jgi:peptidoglycan/LPS O-acetylase OafA/YrhL
VPVPGASSWLQDHATNPHDLHAALRDAILVRGSNWLIPQLWSLKWEVLFSLLLPAYVVIGRLRPSWSYVTAAAILALVIVGAGTGNDYLLYLPMFAAGVLIEFEHARLATAARRIPSLAWYALSALSIVLLMSYWLVAASGAPARHPVAIAVSRGAALVGAALGVFVAGHWRSAVALANRRSIQWLGKRSFSLYLVHEPILVAIAFALGGRPSTVAMLAIGLPVTVAAADIFFRLIEGPSHRFSQRLGRAIDLSRRRRVVAAHIFAAATKARG